MATSEIHWDSKKTFRLAPPTLREISHKGSQPRRVFGHPDLLFTFFTIFRSKLSTFCEGYILCTFVVASPFTFGLGGSSLQLFIAMQSCPLVAVHGLLTAAASLVA